MFSLFDIGIDKVKKYINTLDYDLSSDLHINIRGITITCLTVMLIMFISIIVMIFQNIKYIKPGGNKYFFINIVVMCVMILYFGALAILTLYNNIKISLNDILRYELIILFVSYISYNIYDEGILCIGLCEFGEILIRYKIIYKFVNYLTTRTGIPSSGSY